MTSTSLPSAAQARADLRRELRRDARILGIILMVLWGIWLVDAFLLQGQLRHFGIVTVVGISWESHVFGFGGGALTAWLLSRRRRAGVRWAGVR